MPKTFPIKLEVEEIALGVVLRKLSDMPGIARIDLDLGHGGEGAGKKRLEQAAEKMGGGGNGNKAQAVIKMLMGGQRHIGDICTLVGGNKSRGYGIASNLKKQGLTEAGDGSGMHRLTKKALDQIKRAMPVDASMVALPAPAVKRGPSGRASPGSGPILLRTVLDGGPVDPTALRKQLAEKGMSAKSISGVLERGRRKGLIKKNGTGYELTAKGLKIGAPANG